MSFFPESQNVYVYIPKNKEDIEITLQSSKQTVPFTYAKLKKWRAFIATVTDRKSSLVEKITNIYGIEYEEIRDYFFSFHKSLFLQKKDGTLRIDTFLKKDYFLPENLFHAYLQRRVLKWGVKFTY